MGRTPSRELKLRDKFHEIYDYPFLHLEKSHDLFEDFEEYFQEKGNEDCVSRAKQMVAVFDKVEECTTIPEWFDDLTQEEQMDSNRKCASLIVGFRKSTPKGLKQFRKVCLEPLSD